MSKSILGFLLVLLFAPLVKAEQPIFNISSADANPGQIVDINFNVDNFTEIISAQFSVNWNPDVLEFKAVKNFNASVNGLSPSNFNVEDFIQDGKFTFTWFESSLNPITIPDGSLFFTVEFEVVGDPCQSSGISITNDPLEIEVAEGEEEIMVGLVSNNGEINIPGTGCVEGLTFIGNSVVGTCGSEACVRFTVEDFVSVGAMEFSLVYNPAVLEFNRFQNFAPLLAFGEGNTNLLSPGTLRVVWINSNAENDTLPDGTTLFEICFDVIGTGGQSSQITFGNNPSPMISDIDGNFHDVDIQPAVITAQCALEGFAFLADTVCTEPGTIVCIPISVNDFDDIIAFQFSINWDSTRFEFDHVEGFNLPGLDESGFGTPANLDVDEGELTVSWIDLSLEGVTVPDLSSIFQLCLRAIGPAGSSTAITFSEDPLSIEVATLDSVLIFGLINGEATIRVDCDIDPPCEFSYTITETPPSCPGASDGALNLSVDVGNCVGTPTFLWSTGSLNEDISGLVAGNYTVTITLNGQIIVASEDLAPAMPIEVNASITNPVPPNLNSGAINITVTGGMSPYTFLWSFNNAVTEDLTNIPAGTYTVTITDAKGCVFVPDAFVVGADVTGQLTNATCTGLCNGSITANASFGTAPYTYLWNTVPAQTTQTISNLCPGTYCVTVTDNTGSTRDECFTIITQSQAPTLTANITHDVDEDCSGAIDMNVIGGTGPITYQWENNATTQDIINLCGGEHCVTITYGQGCTIDTCFTVFTGNVGLSLVATQYGNFQTSCSNTCDGEITSVITGGVPPFTYLWSNNATTPDLINLCPGIYSLTVTDATGNVITGTRTITAPQPLSFTSNVTFPTDLTASDGAITIITTGGSPAYTYEWSGPVNPGNVASANNLPPGTYRVTVIDDNGCEFTDFIDLLGSIGTCYSSTPIITPNDDGKNDYFLILCIFDLDNHLSIYNRSGGLVFDTDNYTNTWSGTDNDNEPLPDGGYLWVLEITQLDGTIRILKGTVNLLRTAD